MPKTVRRVQAPRESPFRVDSALATSQFLVVCGAHVPAEQATVPSHGRIRPHPHGDDRPIDSTQKAARSSAGRHRRAEIGTRRKHRCETGQSPSLHRQRRRRPDKEMTRPEPNVDLLRWDVCTYRSTPNDDGPLHDVVVGRFNDLPSAIVSTVLAGPVHHLRVAAIVALHELRRFQLVVIGRAPLPRSGLRVSPFRYSHLSFPVGEYKSTNARPKRTENPLRQQNGISDTHATGLLRWGGQGGCSPPTFILRRIYTVPGRETGRRALCLDQDPFSSRSCCSSLHRGSMASLSSSSGSPNARSIGSSSAPGATCR